MIRFGILGTDGGAKGGHALNILKILSNIDEIEVSGLYGEETDETKELAEAFGIGFVAENAEDLVDKVDAVFVLFRRGDKHKEYAMPFIKKGLPVFIDKPFTCDVSEAEEIVAAAKKSGSIICGGSYIKYSSAAKNIARNMPEEELIQSAVVAYPTVMNSPYGGLHFYSHHLIETMLKVFGSKPISIKTVETAGCPIAVANYGKFSVIMNFASNDAAMYIGVYYKRDNYISEKIDMSGLDEYQCRLFIESIKKGEGEDPEFFVDAVKTCNAFIKSLEENKEIYINK